MVDDHADAGSVEGDKLADSERLAGQVGTPVAQGEMAAVEQTGGATAFRRGAMASGWKDLAIHLILVGITDRALAIVGRERGPQCSASGF